MDIIKPKLIPKKYLKKFYKMISDKKKDSFWSEENIILIIFFTILLILLIFRFFELKNNKNKEKLTNTAIN